MDTSDRSSTIPTPAHAPRDFHYKYTVQKGYFMQSEDGTDDESFNFVRFRLFNCPSSSEICVLSPLYIPNQIYADISGSSKIQAIYTLS